jgi:hypothetical protein
VPAILRARLSLTIGDSPPQLDIEKPSVQLFLSNPTPTTALQVYANRVFGLYEGGAI